jgi:tetratricopeptide (TPR) repeat protein
MSDWVDAEQHAELAHQYYEAGQWDKAVDELRQALSVNPEQSEWQFGLGLTLDALQRYEEAIDAYQHVVRLRGEDVDALLHLGVDLIRVGQPERVLDVLQRAAAADPSAEAPYCHRIAAYTQLGDHEQAEVMFYLARDYSEECPLCYDHIAQSLAMRSQFDRATWCWQRTAALDGQFPGVQVNLARVHWYRGQHQRARQYYLEQLRLDPGDIDTLLELGNLLVAMQRPGEASEKFRRVLELEPQVVEAHLRLGQLALQIGHLDAAGERFERARRLDHNHPGPHLGLALVAHSRGQSKRARQHLALEMKCEGQSPDQVLEMSRLAVELGQFTHAIDLIDPLLREPETSPLDRPADRAAGLVCRGVARLRLGETDAGIADCRLAARLNRDDTMALENLVLAYMQGQRFGRAFACLRQAQRQQPTDPHLRQLRHKLRYHHARHRLRKLLHR